MRIRAKLLITYLILLGLVATGAVIYLPRVAENAALKAEQDRLEAQSVAISERVASGIRQKSSEVVADRLWLVLEDFMVDDAMALVDARGRIYRASRRELVNKVIPQSVCGAARPRERPTLILENVGPLIVACSTIKSDAPMFKGHSVLLVRDLSYVQNMARPMVVRIYLFVLISILFALIVTGWLSANLVRRLRATGEAAEALAEGDLTRRAPVEGRDEIAGLADNFNHMAERIEKLVDGLRRSEQSRRELLMMVGHDLRTPLTSIGGFAEALRDGVVQGEERKQRYYQIIASESTRLNRLVNDLFDMAKLEAGQLELRLQVMPVTPWLVEFAESFRPVAEGLGTRLVLAIAPEAEGSRIYGDRDRLDQVLNNLLANAVRFSPTGRPVVMGARVDGPDVEISVRDEGPGLAPEEAERVFERFFQGNNPGKGHKGAGLGLAIVKSLVEAHGGAVGVQSTPGAGATFWVRLKRQG